MIPQSVADIIADWHKERLKPYAPDNAKEPYEGDLESLVGKVYVQGVLDCAEEMKKLADEYGRDGVPNEDIDAIRDRIIGKEGENGQ